MSSYAAILEHEDPRIAEIFDVEGEALREGSQIIEDPFPGLGALLAKGGVQKGALGELLGYGPDAGFHFHMQGRETYTALSFEAVSRTLIENQTFSSEVYEEFAGNAQLSDTILHAVGPEHRRMRNAIQPYFTPDVAESWWNDKIIAETVETLISKIEVKTSADLFLELCARMPVHVVSAGFGLPPEDIVPFRIAVLGGGHREHGEEQTTGLEASARILDRVIEERRRNPQDDIISKLVHAEIALDDGGKRQFTNVEIINHCRLIVLAGGGTTWRQLGITLFALLDNPDQLEDAKADRSLLPKVILESARWHATDLIFPRRVTKDVNLCGVDIPEGALLHMCLGSANRDPTRWENPDKFDIHRPVQRALAFGGGPHSCLGQHVSRQEMVVALNAIFDRLPNVRWDTSKPRAKMTGGLFTRGPSALPVVFG
jgi:cytochrome P450